MEEKNSSKKGTFQDEEFKPIVHSHITEVSPYLL